MSDNAAQNITPQIIPQEPGENSSSEPIVKTGGEKGLTWDELDILDGTADKKAYAERYKTKKAPPEKKPETHNAPEIEAEPEVAEGESEVEAKDGEAKPEAKEKPKPEDKKDGRPAAKIYKLKTPTGEVSLAGDTPIQVKIDGKEETVTFEEMKNEYSGKVAWSRKYNELDRERKEFHTERDELTRGVNRLYDLAVKESNPRAAIEHLAESIGADPRKVWNDLQTQLTKQIEEFVKLTPEERAAAAKDEELDYLRRKDETGKANSLRQKEISDTETRVVAVQETLGIDKKIFFQRYSELEAEAKASGKNPDLITPELVGEYHTAVVRTEAVQGIVEGNFKDHPKADKIQAELMNVWKLNPKWTADQIKEVALDAFGKQAPKKSSLAKKVEKSRSTGSSGQRNSQTEPAVDWDSI